jgi:hypothetical protein
MDVIDLFFRQPSRSAHVREVARVLKISPTTASARLEALHKEGLLAKDAKYHHLLFSAADAPLFWDARRAYLVRELRRSGLLEHLMSSYAAQAVVLLDEPANIRLAVITDHKRTLDTESYVRTLGIPVDIKTVPCQHASGMGVEVLNDVANGLTLLGRWEAFR